MVHPNGQPGEHGVVITPRASAAVVIDGDDVILTRQARYAIDRHVLEIVKGGADGDESPQAAAERELREELGIVANRWDELGIIYEIPRSCKNRSRSFSPATSAPSPATPKTSKRSSRTHAAPRSLLAAARGELNDAVTGLALLRAAQRLEDERTAEE